MAENESLNIVQIDETCLNSEEYEGENYAEYYSPFGVLPEEILLNIFGYLKEIDRMKIVSTCKRWNRVIGDKSLYHIPDKNILGFIVECCEENLVMSLTRAIHIAENDYTSWEGPISLTWGTALIAAAGKGNIPIATKMISAGGTSIGIKQAISAAIINGHLKMVKFLIGETRIAKHTAYVLYVLAVQNKKDDISSFLKTYCI